MFCPLLLFSRLVVSNSFCDPKDRSPPGSPSMGFPRQEYWSGVPLPSPGDLPDRELNACFLHCRQIPHYLFAVPRLYSQRMSMSPSSSCLWRKWIMVTHSSTLAWKISWTEEPGRLHAVHGVVKSRTRWATSLSLWRSSFWWHGWMGGYLTCLVLPSKPPRFPLFLHTNMVFNLF